MRSAVKRKEPSVSGFEMYISVIDERIFEPFMRKRMISRFAEEFCEFVPVVWVASEVCEEVCVLAGCAASVFVSSSFLDNSFSFSIICERRT